MIYTMGMIIALVSVFTEVKLVHGSKFIHHLYVDGVDLFWRWHIEGIWFNTAGSFLLSWFMGKIFGATGTTIAFGGAVSTGLSQIWFWAEGVIADNMGDVSVGDWIRERIQNIKDGYTAIRTAMSDFAALAQDIWSGIVAVWNVITWPFRVTRQFAVWYGERRK